MKNFKQYKLLRESAGKLLLSIDVQPEYEEYISFDIASWIDWLETSNYDQYVLMFNGPELGMVSKDEYISWLYEKGMSEEFIDSCIFYDKTYAFFRSCMDSGYEDGLVELIKYMWETNNWSSDSLDDEEWDEVDASEELKEFLKTGEQIHIPNIMDSLENITKPIDLVGGGDRECLEEIRLCLQALDKDYTDISKYIY